MIASHNRVVLSVVLPLRKPRVLPPLPALLREMSSVFEPVVLRLGKHLAGVDCVKTRIGCVGTVRRFETDRKTERTTLSHCLVNEVLPKRSISERRVRIPVSIACYRRITACHIGGLPGPGTPIVEIILGEMTFAIRRFRDCDPDLAGKRGQVTRLPEQDRIGLLPLGVQ